MVEDPQLLEHVEFSLLVMTMEKSPATLKANKDALETQHKAREKSGTE